MPFAKRYLRLTTWHGYVPPDDGIQFDWDPCTCNDCKGISSDSVSAVTIDDPGIHTINPWVGEYENGGVMHHIDFWTQNCLMWTMSFAQHHCLLTLGG